MGDAGDGREVLSDQLSEDAVACAVKDADAVGTDLDGVVNEVGDGLQRLVATHAAEVDLLAEMQAFLVHGIGRVCTEEGGTARCGTLQGGLVDALQTLRGDGTLDRPEGYDGLLALYFQDASDGRLALHAHRVARGQRTLCFRLGDGRLRGGRRLFLALLAPLLTLAHLLHLASDAFVVFVRLADGLFERVQFAACGTRAFLLGLCLADLTDRVLDAGIGFADDALCSLFGLADNYLPLAVHGLEILFVARDQLLELLLAAADVLSLVFPVTLVADNVLEILVHVDIIAAHLLGGFGDDVVRQTDLAGDFDGE